MTRVLVVHYSQTGQLTDVVKSFVGPLLQAGDEFEVVFENLAPVSPYPFPWPFLEFFTYFPETVYMDPIELAPLELDKQAEGFEENKKEFDLVILAYQVWFLSPSQPITGFLKSDAAQRLLKDKPVITLIACRDMWLMAQEKVKKELNRLGAHLIDNVVLVDEVGSGWSFLSTPLWMFTGKKGPWGPVPAAGVSKSEIVAASRFGDRIVSEARKESPNFKEPLFKGLGAVKIKEKTIAGEKLAHRSFLIWGKLIKAVGGRTTLRRKIALCFYITFLICLILTVVPISALIKKLISPLTKNRTLSQKAYFAFPSGEDRSLINSNSGLNE